MHNLMNDATNKFFNSNWLLESWKRSESAGLVTTQQPQHVRLDRTELSEKKYHSRKLIKAIESVSYPLFQQMFHGTDSRLILTDPDGVILASWGQMSFQDRLHNIALELGVCWQECLKGTNAIGAAITENRVVSVIGGEHFIRHHRFVSCTAAPILSSSGEVLGVLDITSEQAVHGQDTQVLLRNMGQLTENWLLKNMRNSSVSFEFAKTESLLDTGWQGIIITDDDRKVIAKNQFASNMLQTDIVMGMSIDSLLDSEEFDDVNSSIVYRTESLKSAKASTQKVKIGKSGFCLHFGDISIEKIWLQASKLVDKDISILICGETGTGKGELVKALHRQSLRSQQPLVAVNCGAIPSELIESELFGYKGGAFTGASPKGSIGKIRAADKGILFLDEIADMSLSAQCRLLQVLQDSEVVPVGATSAVQVNVRIVAATHKDLPAMVASGEFRQDLYYRLNGLIIDIPPLRKRQDKIALIEHIHHNYSNGQQTLSEELMVFLSNHQWPGNLRELDNTIKVATLLSEEAKELHTSHLPEYLNKKNTVCEDVLPTNFHERTLSQYSDDRLLKVYSEQDRNISRTAKKLNISRQTLYRKLKRLGKE